MTRYPVAMLLAFALVHACSSSDQSLGETRQAPPVPVPIPDIDPDSPDVPGAKVSPCEDATLHADRGACLPVAVPCPELLRAGYECSTGLHCCKERPIGCGLGSCGGGMSTGGAGDDGPALPPDDSG